MAEFKIQSEFTPQGDQPAAIDALVDGLNRGEQYQTLLGVPVRKNIFNCQCYTRSTETYVNNVSQ
ncbi:hypothetical protein Ct9H90mP29_20490 [bacterium]|nr:MAG: hypothetical protein Ct9H90mP29_20490 [bacterium]